MVWKLDMRLTEKFFSDKEMACKGVKCGCGNVVIIDPIFDKKLFDLRKYFNMPMRITSASRCKVHNDRVGGASRSFHISDHPAWVKLKGSAAVDISYVDHAHSVILGKAAWKFGFRIGYNKKFLHIDSAAHHGILPQAIFKYDNVTDQELEAFKKEILK